MKGFGNWKVTCTNHHSTIERFDFRKNKNLRKDRLNGSLKANQAQGSAEGIRVVQEKEVCNQTGN